MSVSVSEGKVRTPVGDAPVVPLFLIGLGLYLTWFAVKYWRGTGQAEWPSYPIKSVLQGKGVPPNTAAGAADAQLAAYDAAQASSGTGQAPGTSTAGGRGSASGPANANEELIIRGVLTGLAAPQTKSNIDSMANWRAKETPWPPVAAFNPWNTTLPMPGASNFNSVGVKNYTSWGQGISATVLTLQGGYPGIVASLRAGTGVCGGGHAAEFSKWSGGGYTSVC